MTVKSMKDLDPNGKTVVLCKDLNFRMNDGRIFNDKRIRAALPTLKLALEKGAGVIVLSHLGSPTEGEYAEEFSLNPVAERLGQELDLVVRLAKTFDEAKVKPGEVCVLENVRFNKGEKQNDPELEAKYASLVDVYVMDAFATAHCAQTSTEGAIRCVRKPAPVPFSRRSLMPLPRCWMLQSVRRCHHWWFQGVNEAGSAQHSAGAR